ncbi:MAG: TIM barrel protein, partial [Actinomycetota bacterium]
MMKPKIAVCTHMIPSIEEVAALAQENGSLAIDYSLESQKLDAVETDIERLHELTRGSDLEIRYHCFFGDVEIGHTNADHGDMALTRIKEAIDGVQRFGGRYVTLHVGLNSRVHGELDWENALKNLR